MPRHKHFWVWWYNFAPVISKLVSLFFKFGDVESTQRIYSIKTKEKNNERIIN
jgi:hypothetical protein